VEKQLGPPMASSKSGEGARFLMSNQKKEPQTSAGQAAPGTTRVEKVRSSRYEWENKSAENENPHAESKVSRSLMASFTIWLKKFFSEGCRLFDNDDDATPSAA
jgi:hypothetical protein